ncbi:MAG: hypothetical protein WAO09_05430 [Candidatus Dormiibacterota bacterium]|jgi:hypothetical protein
MRKLVVSGTLPSANWVATTVVGGDLAGAMIELKSRLGGELLVLGRGKSLMHGLGNRLRLELLGTRIFDSGNVLLL